MKFYGRVWTFLAGCGILWQGVEFYDRMWNIIAGFVIVWQGVELYSRVWNYMAGCDLGGRVLNCDRIVSTCRSG